ncbi:calcium sensing receptor, chloroplastic [Humulus lupulus]|uniref:calcium sensing receptor, chloroplastic n=1 Tax=Humulus lupulus TaxID=3486 RepID=UPI002B417BBF|nr:calcium sensing receptor, chloroplastic [Humulus lupulus]
MTMEMAIRASATTNNNTRPHLSTPKTFLKPQFRPSSVSLPASSTTITLLGLFTPLHDAKALTLPKDQITSSLTEFEKRIDQVQQVGSSVFDTTAHVLEVLINAAKPVIEVALPIAKQAGEQALKIASPFVSEVSKTAQEAIQSSGFDTQPVVTAAKTIAGAAQQTSSVIEGVKPIASSTFETISSSDPLTIVGSAGALFLTYLLFPPVWSVISFNFRGYKGQLTPAQTLDLISTKNYIMIDIRTEKEKDKAGIPRLPSNAKIQVIAIPLEELPSKLRGLVRNVKKLQAEIAALKISYLKRVNKGSSIVILDSYLDSAKIVARTLTSLGFKNCWTVADGFSGSRGWLQSRLGIDSYNFSFAEVISPSRVIPASVRRFGTTSSTTQSAQKLLPE